MLLQCTAAVLMAVSAARAEAVSIQPYSVGVMVLNEGGVAASVLARAKAEAARIYQRLGVNLVWSREGGEEHRLTIKIVATPLDARDVSAAALGVAPATGSDRGAIAYAFYERIRQFSENHSVEIVPILGSVIAHELGHLLLPHGSHSRGGVMNGVWDDVQAVRAAEGLLSFSASESMSIRATLRASEGARAPIAPQIRDHRPTRLNSACAMAHARARLREGGPARIETDATDDESRR